MLEFLSLLLVIQTVIAQMDDLQLIFVQAIWNYGDISPVRTYKKDPFQEANWTFGGGGFGQLSPTGMKQQLNLGRLLKEKYVDTNFLSPNYTSGEIYIRSTDTNRAITSAMCNILGMYGQKDESNRHYPTEPTWPAGLVPIPVHTPINVPDHVGDPDAPCKRRERLWKLAMRSKEVKEFATKNVVGAFLRFLSKTYGQEVRLENFHEIREILAIEKIYYGRIMNVTVKWFTESLEYVTDEIANQTQLYINGIFDPPIFAKGLDIGYEIKKVRGGAFINELSARMELKLNCIQNYEEEKCGWIKPLKYYAYSVHASTLFQFFAILGMEDKMDYVYPKYAAAATLELYVHRSNNQKYFRLMFRPNDESDFNSITKEIPGCVRTKDYCGIEVFKSIAERFNPNMTMEKFCRARLFKAPTTSKPPTITTTTTTTTTSAAPSAHLLPPLLLLPVVYVI